jgi:cell wall-associated NlpC family hydrolase
MSDWLATLPPGFRTVGYDGAQIPDGSHDLSRGANCQRYAYAVLAHFGIDLPPWRSSELWADATLTESVTTFEPLDLLLFNPTDEPYGAHVAIYAGAGQALHLAKSVGRPAIWSLAEFAAQPSYRVLIGGKRALR